MRLTKNRMFLDHERLGAPTVDMVGVGDFGS